MTSFALPRDISDLMNSMWADIQRDANHREEQRAKADPRANRFSKVFENTSYRYVYAGRNGKNQSVWYCWSCHRNVAGYFLGWRETRRRNNTVKRDQWTARRKKIAVREIAEARAERFRLALASDREGTT